ncbi:two-component SAPR family response regulator [Deinobacterium chartae]|uniref:Two-component SAPR family response regulator n=1 Tax=Deinobacterium chartae TaxID=521158 RepID=A0A841HXG7_9DEIO|nr:two-component SAPR family response regulator [Deinobacterium chartae]
MNGVPARWNSASAQELFFYLLSHPQGRSRDEILEDLWQLGRDAASVNRFRVTVHRVRTALGWSGALVEEYGRYRLAPEVLDASDVQALYAALQQAEATLEPRARLEGFRQVLHLSEADYLPGVRAEWAEAAREEHRALYVRACVEVSLAYCEEHNCAEAAAALVRALKRDPYVGENLHQRLMACLTVVEGKYAAIEHYRRFLRFLREDLEDCPMPETVELAERIKCGEGVCPRALQPRPDAACLLVPGSQARGVLP